MIKTKLTAFNSRKLVLAALCLCLASLSMFAAGKKNKSGVGEDGWKYGYFTTDDGVRLHYEEFGTGSKTILGVHGYMGSGTTYKETFALIQGDFHFVVYDERAHGLSETPKNGYTMTRYAQDLKNLIDHLQLKNIIIIGYSMGMHIVWDYIRQFGDGDFDKIVSTVMSPKIYNTETYKLGTIGLDLEGAVAQMANYNANYTDIFLAQQTQFKDFLAAHKAYKDFYDGAVSYDPGAMTRLLIAMYTVDYWDVLPKITKPVLFVTAEKDMYPLASFERQKNLVKGPSSLVVIPTTVMCLSWTCRHSTRRKFKSLCSKTAQIYLQIKFDNTPIVM